jgi:hypothetical protein
MSVSVYTAVVPGATETDDGACARVNDPLRAAVTVRVAVTVDFVEPLVPVMVKVELAAGVDFAVTTVSVDVPCVIDEVSETDEGENDAVAPLGNPLTVNATDPAKPFAPVAVTL